jgi:hypothetical protein
MTIDLHSSLGYYRRIFHILEVPEIAALRGVQRAEFVGPLWLRKTAGPAVALGGLRHWGGKEVDSEGHGMNLVQRRGRLERVLPMQAAIAMSLVDGQMGVSIGYAKDSPFPWPLIVDEVRRLDATTLLAFTVINVSGLRLMSSPFILHFEEHVDVV